MTVRDTYTTESRHIALLSTMARSLAVKTALQLTRGCKVVFSPSFLTSLGLRRVPEASKLAGNESLSWYRPFNKHPRGTNTIQNGVRHMVM